MALINQPPNTPTVSLDSDGNLQVDPTWASFFNNSFAILSALTQSGTTANRPTKLLWTGRTFYDVSLNKPIWYTTGGWRDSDRSISVILERTTDVARIKSIIEHPEIAPLIFEGEAPIPIHDSIYYLIAKEGLVAFIPINSISWNPHIAVLPEYRGTGTELMKSGLEWMFKNTPCRKVVAFPPAYNKAMIRVFDKCGFKQEGYSPNSFMFKGNVYDRLLLGIEG